MRTIGILGGIGPQASAKLLELIIAKTPQFTNVESDEDFPEIVLLNLRIPNFVSNENNFDASRKILIEKTKILNSLGCGINAIACNTAHLFLDDIRRVSSSQFLAIPELVKEKIEQNKFKKVGILGTPNTIKSRLFDNELTGIEIVRPNNQFLDIIEDAIFAQLTGSITKKQKNIVSKMVQDFKIENKLDAVILGCTELTLIIGDSSEDNTIIDTLDLLAENLLRECFCSAENLEGVKR